MENFLFEANTTETCSPGAEWPILLELASPTPDAGRLAGSLRGAVDWSALLTLAEDHGLLALAAMRLRDCQESTVPSPIRQKLREWQRAHTLSTLSMTAELFRLLERFAASGIETLAIKGPVLSVRCHGDPGMRQYGDLDLIVRSRDIRRTTELMLGLGYEPKVPLPAIDAGKIPGEYVFLRTETRLRVEFHTENTFRYYPRPLQLNGLFARQTCVQFDAHKVPALSPEDELILISIHGAKHLWERLMWIADVAALATRTPHLDWKRAMSSARELGAERMLNLGLRLSKELLHAALPQEIIPEVSSDERAGELAVQIQRWLPTAGAVPPGLLERARFRMRLRGGFFSGTAYLLRLSLSPTEEDWAEGAGHRRPWLLDALRRPLRLARKYGRAREASIPPHEQNGLLQEPRHEKKKARM